MIIAKLFAGLGNQMFEYAAAKSLALLHNTDVKLDIFSYVHDNHRAYGLDAFCIEANRATLKDIANVSPEQAAWCHASIGGNDFLRKVLSERGIENRCILRYYDYDPQQKLPPLQISNVVSQRMYQFDPDFFQCQDNVITYGTWVSYKYFEQTANIMRKEFILKRKSERFKKIENNILEKKSVAVHVRRTDKLAGSGYPQIDIDFYIKAIDFFRERYSNSCFFVFSDDIGWTKKNISASDVVHVESLKNVHPAEDMLLMSKCRHNVVPASSYSWWSAWLNANPNKQVLTVPSLFWGWEGAPNWNLSTVIPDNWEIVH